MHAFKSSNPLSVWALGMFSNRTIQTKEQVAKRSASDINKVACLSLTYVIFLQHKIQKHFTRVTFQCWVSTPDATLFMSSHPSVHGVRNNVPTTLKGDVPKRIGAYVSCCWNECYFFNVTGGHRCGLISCKQCHAFILICRCYTVNHTNEVSTWLLLWTSSASKRNDLSQKYKIVKNPNQTKRRFSNLMKWSAQDQRPVHLATRYDSSDRDGMTRLQIRLADECGLAWKSCYWAALCNIFLRKTTANEHVYVKQGSCGCLLSGEQKLNVINGWSSMISTFGEQNWRSSTGESCKYNIWKAKTDGGR
jgi:hypothetical protein